MSDRLIIVASGPSAAKVRLHPEQGKFLAVNNSWKLCPWADYLYAGDMAWWVHAQGCPEFKGRKITGNKWSADRFGLEHVPMRCGSDRMHFDGTIGFGGCSGFQALNWAVNQGHDNIWLVGFDFTTGHWHDDYPEGMHNPREQSVARWLRSFKIAAGQLKDKALVFNCSHDSAMKEFPICDL